MVGDTDILAQLMHEPAIFLSPHHDDICFSLAGVIAKRKSGALVNVFTRSEFMKRPTALPADVNERTTYVTAVRVAEDKRFAEAVGLTRHDLNFAEPPLRGFHPSDSRELAPEIAQVQAALLSFLEMYIGARERSGSRVALFCPMAIGGHRDHILMLHAVKRIMKKLPAYFDVFLYEDLQYASVTMMRYAGIYQASSIMRGFQMSRLRIDLSSGAFARKLELVALYGSQFISTISAADFIPADSMTPKPHEAFWRVYA